MLLLSRVGSTPEYQARLFVLHSTAKVGLPPLEHWRLRKSHADGRRQTTNTQPPSTAPQVLEAVEQVSSIIRLQAYSTFTLFVAYKPVVAKVAAEGGPGDEHTLLDDNRCVLTKVRCCSDSARSGLKLIGSRVCSVLGQGALQSGACQEQLRHNQQNT